MISLHEAVSWLQSRTARLGGEVVPVGDAAGRVLNGELAAVQSPAVCNLDGYAVLASQTQGASDYAPLPVRSEPVVAGAALPGWADAVLPMADGDGQNAMTAIAPGDGLALPDGLALAAGTVLHAMHLAVLARRGLQNVNVVRRPAVRLRVAGPKSGADALTPMLTAWIDGAGGRVAEPPDLVLHAGRSAAGPDDHGIAAFDRVFSHGVRLRPGETAALGSVDGTPALLLPGDPAAAAIVFALIGAPALRRMAGRAEPAPSSAALTRKISAGLGEVSAVPVVVRKGQATPVVPILSALASADGLILVPESSEGYPAGSTVAIWALT